MLKISILDILKIINIMHAKNDPEKFTSTRLTLKTLNLLNEVKAKKKSSTHDELIYQMLIFFQNNDIDPANFKKPIPEQIADLRDTFVTFFRTFEEKKMLPYVERTDQSLILILEILQNFDLNKAEKQASKNLPKNEVEQTIIPVSNSNDLEIKRSVLGIVNDIERKKQFNQKGGTAIVEMLSTDYNDLIDKLKKLCL
jgi:hypothetical protein